MTLQFAPADAIIFLKQFLENNKARGMVGEIALDTYLKADAGTVAGKILPGGWVFSPKITEFSKYRYVTFVLPLLFENAAELEEAIRSYESDRGFQSLATFLSQSGIGVIVAAAIAETRPPDPNAIRWRSFIYRAERLIPAAPNKPFEDWPGGRGYARKPKNPWTADIEARFAAAMPEQLTALTLRQAFLYGHLKQQLRKSIGDTYDVDNFIVSYRGSVMPMEIKEKSPTNKGEFGIDAGRILMMLRLCLITDSNGLYLIREIDNSPARAFVRWRCITLSNMILGVSWNLQAGGAGMGGGATQTVMMPGSLFEPFNEGNLSEEWLAENTSLQASAREKAQELAGDLTRFL